MLDMPTTIDTASREVFCLTRAVQWLLNPVFVFILAWFIGWSHFRRLWPRRK
jgi:ACR3 family arsenite efflux pump ArsB